MTEIIYMENIDSNYVMEFDAVVIENVEGAVVLDRTAFYAEGGGQPSDKGSLSFDGKTLTVKKVTKSGKVKHHIDGEIPVGTTVHGVIDWELRHSHMRMHTAQHLISGVAYDLYGARTRGNQIKPTESRLDLGPLENDIEVLEKIEVKTNEIIQNGFDIFAYIEERDSLLSRTDPLRSNLDLIPSSIKNLRVIDIGKFDLCPCAGTHVKNTNEIGKVVFTKNEKKGKGIVRIRYILE